MTFEFLLVIIGLLVLWGVNLYVHWRGAKWLDEQKIKDSMMGYEDAIEDMEDAKDEAMRDIAWKVHVMISDGKSIAEIDHYVCGICDF